MRRKLNIPPGHKHLPFGEVKAIILQIIGYSAATVRFYILLGSWARKHLWKTYIAI